MKNWKTDVAVLLIFFVRDDVFKKTFAAVKEARPSTLLLFQDGPRENHPDDIEGIKRCREIAEDIDWECTVYKNYQEKNYGCDPATFYSHKWAFTLVNKCIILEDDCVPSLSFFPFCKELLDKYESDNRINRIIGMNNLGEIDSPYDYIFVRTGSCGWATWKRVASQWDEFYNCLDDEYFMNLLSNLQDKDSWRKYYKLCLSHKKSQKPHWETIVALNMLLTSSYNIMATKNLIENIGISENATHTVSDSRLIPSKQMSFYQLKSHELEFPLKHPPFLVEDRLYLKQFRNFLRTTTIMKVEMVGRRIIYGRFDLLWQSILKRLKLKK